MRETPIVPLASMTAQLASRTRAVLAMVVGLGLLALLCLAWTPFALVLHPLLPPAAGKRVGRTVIRRVFRFYATALQVLCGCRFDLRALDALAREPGPMVVVANHPSLLDAVLLASRLPDAVCVMKGRLMHNLLLGAGARLARYIVNDVPLTMIRDGIAELRGGARLILFPEGTRTIVAPVSPCSDTAGLIAARAQVPVRVLAIEMSSPYLGKHWPIFRPPELPLEVRVRDLGRLAVSPATARQSGANLRDLLARSLSADLPAHPAPPARADDRMQEQHE